MSFGRMPDGYYDDKGEWQRTKFCFVYCQERCTCGPPMGAHYSEAHDKRILKPVRSEYEPSST